MTAERRVIPGVPQEVHGWGWLDVPHPASRDATNVNEAVLDQNRIVHTSPQRVVGTVVPFGTRTVQFAALRVDPLAPEWFPLAQGAWAPGALALVTSAESAPVLSDPPDLSFARTFPLRQVGLVSVVVNPSRITLQRSIIYSYEQSGIHCLRSR